MSSIFELNERIMSPSIENSLSSGGDSELTHSHAMNDRALEKLALELSMLDLTNHSNFDGLQNSSELAATILNLQQQHHQQQQQQQQNSPGSGSEGILTSNTLNAFSSVLGFSSLGGVSFDDRKKSQNMTECGEFIEENLSRHSIEVLRTFFFFFHSHGTQLRACG